MIAKITLGVGTVAVASLIFWKLVSRDERISTNLQSHGAISNVAPIRTSSVPAQERIAEFPVHISKSDTDADSAQEKVSELQELSMRNDPQSFEKIISELSNPLREIREAALEATIQFGNRDAIPILKELAARTEDPREKVEILDAIEYLELPSFREIRTLRKTDSNPANPIGAP